MFASAKAVLPGVALLLVGACSDDAPREAATRMDYDIVATGTRRFEWDTDSGAGWIRVLLEEENLGSRGAEVAEIYFPPGYKGVTHPHELEIIYVLEGELDHIVNGESHILTPGMVGVVRRPDLVVHRTNSSDGVRVLVIWPLGEEVQDLAGSGMREIPLR